MLEFFSFPGDMAVEGWVGVEDSGRSGEGLEVGGVELQIAALRPEFLHIFPLPVAK